MARWQRAVVVGWVALALGGWIVGCATDDGGGAPDGVADAADSADAAADGDGIPDGGGEGDTAAPRDLAGDDVAADDVGADVPPRPSGPYEVPSGPVDLTFHAGPWLGATTTTSVVVSWQTAEPGDSVVEFGRDETYGGRAEGPAGTTLHEVAVDGLEPETIYHYRACTDATCTGDLTFATAPLPDRLFRFAVYSDTQTRFETHGEVSASIRESLPALVLHAGDVVGNGGDRASYVSEYFEPARRRNHYVPTFAAPGNHDWKDIATDIQNFRDYFAFPVDPAVPLPESSYAFTYGDAFFIALDNTLDGGHFFFPLGGVQDPPLWDWLVAQAASEAAQAARWRFAFFHYAPESACQETWMQMRATRDEVLPLLRENGFQAVFAGHTHEYEHQHHEGVHAFVTGGGGGALDSDESCTREFPALVSRQSLHHHLTVDLGPEQATVRVVATDGTVADEVILDRVPTP